MELGWGGGQNVPRRGGSETVYRGGLLVRFCPPFFLPPPFGVLWTESNKEMFRTFPLGCLEHAELSYITTALTCAKILHLLRTLWPLPLCVPWKTQMQPARHASLCNSARCYENRLSLTGSLAEPRAAGRSCITGSSWKQWLVSAEEESHSTTLLHAPRRISLPTSAYVLPQNSCNAPRSFV